MFGSGDDFNDVKEVAERERQGNPLVHFSAEPEPFWSVTETT